MELDDDEYETTREFHENKRRKAMEEIDIIELLKRVKEGKAPRMIELNDTEYVYINDNDEYDDIETMYESRAGDSWLKDHYVFFDTKITILDKPIIEELEMIESMDGEISAYPNEEMVFKKINEIIKHINKEGK